MGNAKSSSELLDGSVSTGTLANSGLGPASVDDTLTSISDDSYGGIGETLQEAFQRITQAQPQTAIPNTSPKSSTATTPQSSGVVVNPAPVEGQCVYMSGPMGLGFYIYRNGQWREYYEVIEETRAYFWGRCECGAEKSGQPGHSSWCPKFEGK
jgi:hypothetical protein